MAHLQHLVSFVHTAEHGSFSAAARVLGLTPAGVSKNVARLEARIAFGRLIARYPGLQLAGAPQRDRRIRFRGWRTLPVSLG